MDREQLADELKALHRGRGVRRPRVDDWLGPGLTDILGAQDSRSDTQTRAALVGLLKEHTERLPADLRWLFRVAAGLTVDLPLLKDRLELAEAKLDRRPRVLRRHLREAELLVADSLLASAAAENGHFTEKGWRWGHQWMHLDLADPVTLTLRRTGVALADRRLRVQEAYTLPNSLTGGDLGVEAIEGIGSIEVERIGAGSWEVEYELERELSRGEHLDVGVRLHVPDRHALSPLLVAAPIRRATEMRVSIDFGDPPVVRRVWVLDGVFPAVAMSGQEPSAAIVLPTTDPVDQVFLAPRPGLCYGFGWEWA